MATMTIDAQFATKELSEETWGDFVALFSRPGNGWNACWCMLCQRGRHLSRKDFPTKASQAQRNEQDKEDLVHRGQAHGIIVYAENEPVGWCQFGPSDELPLSDDLPQDGPHWRITCFVTDKRFRRRGVAAVALRSALAAIAERGGGLVEGYPLDVTKAWPYTGTVELFAKEGFTEARRFLIHSNDFPRYDKNNVTNGSWVVVMQRTM